MSVFLIEFLTRLWRKCFGATISTEHSTILAKEFIENSMKAINELKLFDYFELIDLYVKIIKQKHKFIEQTAETT